jgi:K+-sensing histidine kinase KdpD
MARFVLIPSKDRNWAKESDLLNRCMPHDLNNCLTFMYGRVLLTTIDLEDKHPRKSNFELAVELKRTLPFIDHIRYVGNAINKLNHFDEGMEDFSLEDTLNSLVSFMHAKQPSAGIIATKFQFKNKCHNLESPIYLQSLHFLQNAYKFNPDSKSIILTATEQAFGLNLDYLGPNKYLYSADDPCIKIQVSDKGPGIDHSKLSEVFNLSYSTSKKRRSFKGGIGLAMCEPISYATHGFVEVNSVLGQGSTFSYTFAKERKQSKSKS